MAKMFLAYGYCNKDGDDRLYCIVCGRTRSNTPICAPCENKAEKGIPQLIQNLSPSYPAKLGDDDVEYEVEYSVAGHLVGVRALD